MMKYNLTIVDDHKMFLDGLISILQSTGDYHITFTSQNGKNLVSYLEKNPHTNINLVITDLSMPIMNGILLNKFIKENYPKIKVLVVSMHSEITKIKELLNNDVDGYVPKNAEKKELLKAVKTILNGEKYFSKEIMNIYIQSGLGISKDKSVMLTHREIDVLKLIAQEFTTEEIADQLFLSKHTIESYRKNLISKLNVRNLAGLTKYALKMGYIEA